MDEINEVGLGLGARRPTFQLPNKLLEPHIDDSASYQNDMANDMNSLNLLEKAKNN